MRSQNFIKTLIVLGLVASYIIVWTPIPAAENPDPAYVARGAAKAPEQKEAEVKPEEPAIVALIQDDMDAGYLLLVNKEHSLLADYKPADLESILYFAEDRSPEGRYLRADAAEAFHRLVQDAESAGFALRLTTGYRSYGFQRILYNNYVANEGQAKADTFSAEPGKSEHQTGLAADVSASSVDYRLTTEFGEAAEGEWLAQNAHSYGFIIRFPKGKEEITGYMYEPWHIRFVGKTAAKYIYEHELTLEEFLESIKQDIGGE